MVIKVYNKEGQNKILSLLKNIQFKKIIFLQQVSYSRYSAIKHFPELL